MTRFRTTTQSTIQDGLATATLDWEPAADPSSLDGYVVRHGVPHLFELGRIDEAGERMLDLAFMSELTAGFETYLEPLSYWRVAGIDRAQKGFEDLATELDSALDPSVSELADARIVGNFLYQAGLLHEAVALLRWVLEVCEACMNEDDPDLFTAQESLGLALTDTGDTEAAVELLKKALSGSRRILGDKDRETLGRMNNLANTYHACGIHAAEAGALFQECLDGTREVLGPDHYNSHIAANNLAHFLSDVGEKEKALGLTEEAYQGLVRALGEDHPVTLDVRCNLVALKGDQGEDAIEELYAVLGSQFQVLQEDHPSALQTMHLLGIALEEADRLSEAEPLLGRAADARERVHGREHRDTASSMYQHGIVLGRMERFTEALARLESALEIEEAIYGDTSEEVALTLNYLAITLHHGLSKPEAAIVHRRRCLEIMEGLYGLQSCDVLDAVDNLVEGLIAAGFTDEAQKELERVLAIVGRTEREEDADLFNRVEGLKQHLASLQDPGGT